MKKFNSETNLQIQVADYLRLQYPNVLFHSDYGSGVKLTIGQAVIQKRLNGGKRAWPDMMIAKSQRVEERGYYGKTPFIQTVSSGLFLELKKDGTKLKREKDCKKILKGDTKLRKVGDWWDQHIEEQAEMLEALRQEGYKAEFAIGFDEAKNLIDEYLKGAND